MSAKTPLIDKIGSVFARLLNSQSAIGILLFFSAIAAMVVANSSWGGHWYAEFWEKELLISFGEKELKLNLHQFINDGLMAIFFLLVGLEIKREFMAGELSSWRKAAMPIGAAIGGMAFPALIFLAFNSGADAAGWGIPMATDIAFTLGLLNLVRNRISGPAIVFVTSLAVVDDIGAVLVIAFFYTSSLQLDQLYIAGGALALLIAANQLGVRNVFFYAFVGILGIWLAFFYSGIHPTIAGILIAFAIPGKTRINRSEFDQRLKRLYRKYLKADSFSDRFNTAKEDALLKGIRNAGDDARTPLQKIERGLHPFVYFVIMPIFAFSNAGLKIEANFLELLFSTIGIGIMVGLVVGKILGITLFSKLLVSLGIADLPNDTNWKQVVGVSIMAGIGFTMSLFISELAYNDPDKVEAAKSAILVASLLAMIIGLVFIRLTNKPKY